MGALHSAVLDSIALYTPWTHRAVLHSHAHSHGAGVCVQALVLGCTENRM
jgi:hypothetical protein